MAMLVYQRVKVIHHPCGRHSWFVWVMTPSGCLTRRKMEVFVGFKEQKWMLRADKNWESSQQKMEMHRVLLCFDQSKIGFNQPTSDTRPGKRLHNYGKSPFFVGKTHYFYGHFPVRFLYVYQAGYVSTKLWISRETWTLFVRHFYLNDGVLVSKMCPGSSHITLWLFNIAMV